MLGAICVLAVLLFGAGAARAAWEDEYPAERKAFEGGKIKAVKRVIEMDSQRPDRHFNPDAPVYGDPLTQAFLYAVASGNTELIEYLKQIGWVDICKRLFCPVVPVAARRGDIHMIRYLLAQGFEINKHGGAAALKSAALGGHLDTVRFLCEQGADNKRKDYEGKSVLDNIKAYRGGRSAVPEEDRRMRINIPKIIEYLADRDCTQKSSSQR
jgi:ankyrin repeat protein